jgi:hypothetical protein
VPPTAALPPPLPSHYPVSALVARVAWVPLPEEASERAWLLGAGLAFRYRQARVAAYEAGLVAFGGRDYQGRTRYELGGEANLVLLGGGHQRPGPFVALGPNLTFAQVEGLEATPVLLGVQMGFGGAWPIGRGATSVLAEFDVFARGRVDAAAERAPEYRDALTGAASNGSVGAVLRLGFASDL